MNVLRRGVMSGLITGFEGVRISKEIEQKRGLWHQRGTEVFETITNNLINRPNGDTVRAAVSALWSEQQGRLQSADSGKKLQAVHVQFCGSVALALCPLADGDLDTLQAGSIVELTRLYMSLQRVKLGQEQDRIVEIISGFLKYFAFDLAYEAASILPPERGDGYLCRISSRYAEFEEYDKALQIADKIVDNYARSSARRRVVHILAETRGFERAQEVAATIEDKGEREGSYAAIARELINSARVDEALALIVPLEQRVQDGVVIWALRKHIEQGCIVHPEWRPRAEELANRICDQELKDAAFVDIIEALMKFPLKSEIKTCIEFAETRLSTQKSKDRAYSKIVWGISLFDLPSVLGLREPYRTQAIRRFVNSFIEQGKYDNARALVTEHMNSAEEQLLLSDKIVFQQIKNSYTGTSDDLNKAVALTTTINGNEYRKKAFRYLAWCIFDKRPLSEAVAIANSVTDRESREYLLWRIICATFHPIINLFPKDEDRVYAREVAETITSTKYKNKVLYACSPR